MLFIFLLPLAWAQDPEKTCLSSECVALSKRYRSHINISVDPCEDFYDYACGNYPAQHPVPEHAEKMTVLEEMQSHIDIELRELLENTKYGNISRSLHLAKIFFESCTNEKSRKLFGKDPLRRLIDSLDGWSLIDNSVFNETTFQWERLLGNIMHHGVYYVFQPYVQVSINNSAQNILMFDPLMSFLQNREEYAKDHRKYIVKTLEKLGAETSPDTEKRIDALIALEKKLVLITNNDFSPVMLTYGNIKRRFNNIEWDLIINEDIKNALGGVDESTVMHIDTPGYFDQLNKLVTSTPKREIYDYLFWRLVADYIPHLPENFQDLLKEFNENIYGVTKIAPLRDQCVIETRERFGLALASEFRYELFKNIDKSELQKMLRKMKDELRKEFETADWLDEVTRKEALKKLNLMGSKLLYPDYIYDREYVGRRYGNIYLSTNDYFENVISLRKKQQEYDFLKMKRQVGDDWNARILSAGAGYNAALNELEIPAGILRAPMFSSNTPLFINYGAVGAVLAHEITHGFDVRGAEHDERGHYRNWWVNETWATFKNKSKCFVEQYGEEIEPITKEKQNGGNTEGENVADSGGVRLAYQAYKKELAEKMDHRGFPNFQYFSSDKMFFVAYANNFCASSKKAPTSHYLKTDVHSFERFRVNIPLRNLPEFSKAFNCQRGKMMYNPENACRVW